MSSLHVRYRPSSFDEVVGQDDIVKSLKRVIKDHRAQTFLFVGPPGTGKTTLARILANSFAGGKATNANIQEIRAAENTGVDDMRTVIQHSNYRAIGASSVKSIVLDECFHENTSVSTPQGAVPIKSIKVGDQVFNANGVGTVTHHFINQVPLSRLLLLTLTNGAKILCSEDHNFYVGHTWVNACHLRPGQVLSHVNKPVSGVPHAASPQELPALQSALPTTSFGEQVLFSKMQIPISKLLNLQKELFNTTWLKSGDLLKSMWQQACCITPHWQTPGMVVRCYTSGHIKIYGGKSNYLGKNEQEKFLKNEEAEPHVNPRCARKNDCNKRGQWNTASMDWGTWGQRFYYSSTKEARRLFWVGNRVNNFFRQKAARLSNCLHGRHGGSVIKGSYRSGWERPQIKDQQGQRQKENEKVTDIGVACVTRYQQTGGSQFFSDYLSTRDYNRGFVEFHDLEVRGHPSYYVEDVLVHNCHRLSGNAWDALLKAVEEPPPHLYWMFCSTNPAKIPKTILTRCLRYDLKPVPEDELLALLVRVIDAEKLDVADEVVEAVVEEAGGSPRQALVFLEAVTFCETAGQARAAMRSAAQSKEAVDLAKFLMGQRGRTWAEAMKLVKALEDTDAESIRITVTNYLNVVLMGTKGDDKARAILGLLEAFSTTYNQSDKMGPLLISIGMALNLDK